MYQAFLWQRDALKDGDTNWGFFCMPVEGHPIIFNAENKEDGQKAVSFAIAFLNWHRKNGMRTGRIKKHWKDLMFKMQYGPEKDAIQQAVKKEEEKTAIEWTNQRIEIPNNLLDVPT